MVTTYNTYANLIKRTTRARINQTKSEEGAKFFSFDHLRMLLFASVSAGSTAVFRFFLDENPKRLHLVRLVRAS